MVATQDFPRGGKDTEKKEVSKKKKSEYLFKENDGVKRKKLKKTNKKDDSDEEGDYSEPQEKISKKKTESDVFSQKVAAAETLSYKLLAMDMNVLGQVMAVHDLDLVISLPGRIVGTVPITKVSTAYTEGLKSMADEQNKDVEGLKGLKDMFEVGQYVIANVNQPAADHTLKVLLSLDPKDVNANIPSNYVVKRKVLVGAIQSIEDHGYVVDLGIRNARAFLNKSDTPLPEDQTYGIGQVIEVGVKKAVHADNITNANLTAMPKKINKWKLLTLDEDSDFNIDTILPGTIVDAVVEKVIPEGIKLTFYGAEGYVHKDNFPALFDDQNKFAAGDIVKATLLYTLPLVKRIYLSLAVGQQQDEAGLKVGDVVENARVTSSNSAGLFLRLNKTCRGFVSSRHLPDKKDSAEEMKQAHPVGANRKCRILQYAPMDRSYICTMQKLLMKQSVLRLEDLEPGQIVECEVKALKPQGLTVTLGKNLDAFIPRLHWADDPRLKKPEARFIPGIKLRCRVLKMEPEKRKAHLTNKKSLVRSDLPILSRFEDAQIGMELEGTVVMVNSGGILVVFYNDIKGFLPNIQIVEGKVVHPEKLFYVGQVVRCHIISIFPDERKLILSMAGNSNNLPEDVPEVPRIVEKVEKPESNLVQWEVYDCKVTDIGEDVVKVRTNDTDGVIPFGHLSDFLVLVEHILETIRVGDTVEALCVAAGKYRIFSLKESLLELARSGSFARNLRDVQPKSCIPLVVFKVKEFGIFCKSLGFDNDILLGKRDVPPDVADSWKVEKYTSLFGKVLKVETDKLQLSATITGFRPKVKDWVSTLKRFLGSYGRLASHFEGQFRDVKLGQRMNAVVTEVNKLEVKLKANSGREVTMQIIETEGTQHKVGSSLTVFVVWICPLVKKVYVTTNSRIGELLQNLGPAESLKIFEEVPAVVLHTSNNCTVACTVIPNVHALVYLPERGEVNDFNLSKKKEDHYTVGYEYNVIVQDKTEDYALAVTHGQFNSRVLLPKKIWCKKFEDSGEKRKFSESSEAPMPKKYKGEEKKKPTVPEFTDDFVIEDKKTSMNIGDFSWDWNAKTLPVGGASKDDDLSDSGLESDDEATKKPAKKSRVDRVQAAKDEEKHLSEVEKTLMDPDRLPQSPDDFDRLLVSSPNSSVIWLKYMAYHLEQTEIEKARSVARRALKTINFREENEKFNVWMALLNLENLYGTADSVKEVFSEAIQRNDSLRVHQQTALMFATSGKTEQAEELYQTMLKKFKNDKTVWISCGFFYYKSGQLDKARNVLDRSLKSVEKKLHVELIGRFAQMEMKHGDFERGKTMYETLLLTYPKRTDIWSVYVDALTKANYIDEARQILERATALQLPPKKMKFFFQKYVEFEQKHGDPEREEYVRQKAVDYVEKASGEPIEV